MMDNLIPIIKEHYFSDTNIHFIENILFDKYNISCPQIIFQIQNTIFNLFLSEFHTNLSFYSQTSIENIIITLNKLTIKECIDTIHTIPPQMSNTPLITNNTNTTNNTTNTHTHTHNTNTHNTTDTTNTNTHNTTDTTNTNTTNTNTNTHNTTDTTNTNTTNTNTTNTNTHNTTDTTNTHNTTDTNTHNTIDTTNNTDTTDTVDKFNITDIQNELEYLKKKFHETEKNLRQTEKNLQQTEKKLKETQVNQIEIQSLQSTIQSLQNKIKQLEDVQNLVQQKTFTDQSSQTITHVTKQIYCFSDTFQCNKDT
jgi:hypothetical protein